MGPGPFVDSERSYANKGGEGWKTYGGSVSDKECATRKPLRLGTWERLFNIGLDLHRFRC